MVKNVKAKRILSLLTVATLSASLLAGCGSSNEVQKAILQKQQHLER